MQILLNSKVAGTGSGPPETPTGIKQEKIGGWMGCVRFHIKTKRCHMRKNEESGVIAPVCDRLVWSLNHVTLSPSSPTKISSAKTSVRAGEFVAAASESENSRSATELTV